MMRIRTLFLLVLFGALGSSITKAQSTIELFKNDSLQLVQVVSSQYCDSNQHHSAVILFNSKSQLSDTVKQIEPCMGFLEIDSVIYRQVGKSAEFVIRLKLSEKGNLGESGTYVSELEYWLFWDVLQRRPVLEIPIQFDYRDEFLRIDPTGDEGDFLATQETSAYHLKNEVILDSTAIHVSVLSCLCKQEQARDLYDNCSRATYTIAWMDSRSGFYRPVYMAQYEHSDD